MLSHGHSQQYHFVYQSLLLWKEIIANMWRLWFYADKDLLTPNNTYQLVDTGQVTYYYLFIIIFLIFFFLLN